MASMENSVDADLLASMEASRSVSTLFLQSTYSGWEKDKGWFHNQQFNV